MLKILLLLLKQTKTVDLEDESERREIIGCGSLNGNASYLIYKRIPSTENNSITTNNVQNEPPVIKKRTPVKRDEKNVEEAKTLDLSSNKNLEMIIKTLKNASIYLKELNLSGCDLKSLPEIVYNFRNLRKLDLSQNMLEKIPHGIGHLYMLTELNLEKNSIKSLPDWTSSFWDLKLEKLNLSSNEIEPIYEIIGRLTTLTDLDISNNGLKKLPHALCSLKNLKRLNIASNKIDNNSISNLNSIDEIILHEDQHYNLLVVNSTISN